MNDSTTTTNHYIKNYINIHVAIYSLTTYDLALTEDDDMAMWLTDDVDVDMALEPAQTMTWMSVYYVDDTQYYVDDTQYYVDDT